MPAAVHLASVFRLSFKHVCLVATFHFDEAALSPSLQPPQQFKTFKFETPEAVDARKKVKELGDDVKLHEKKIKVLLYTVRQLLKNGQCCNGIFYHSRGTLW